MPRTAAAPDKFILKSRNRCLSLPLLVQDVLVPVPLLLSTANTPSSMYALAGFVSKPLLSPALTVTAAFADGLRKPVLIGMGVGVAIIVAVLVGVGVGPEGVGLGVGEGPGVNVAVDVGVGGTGVLEGVAVGGKGVLVGAGVPAWATKRIQAQPQNG